LTIENSVQLRVRERKELVNNQLLMVNCQWKNLFNSSGSNWEKI